MAKCAPGPSPPSTEPQPPEQSISAADAARIKYSKQRFIYLDLGESAEFRLADGRTKRIRLVSVKEKTDSVIRLVRRADVRLEIDGETFDIPCGPYVLPLEKEGLRLQVDTTSGWISATGPSSRIIHPFPTSSTATPRRGRMYSPPRRNVTAGRR